MFSQSPFHVFKVGRHFVARGSRTHVQTRADARSRALIRHCARYRLTPSPKEHALKITRPLNN